MSFTILQIIFFQLLVTIPIIFFSKKIGLLDIPNERKSLTFLFIVFITDYDNKYINLVLSFSLLIAITGLIDDKYNVNPGTKLILQTLPIFLLIDNNFYLDDLGYYEYFGKIQLGSFAKVFTILCCLLLINAFNYSDGLDGLVTSITVIAIGSLIVYSNLIDKNQDNEYLLLICVPFIFFLIFPH